MIVTVANVLYETCAPCRCSRDCPASPCLYCLLVKCFAIKVIHSGLFSNRISQDTIIPTHGNTSKVLGQRTTEKELYDLMTMAFKYQVLLCPRPRDLLLVSFNHFDGVRELVKANPRMVNLISEAQRQFTETYIHLSDGEFQLVRQSLLTLFHDMHVKVSFFLQEKIQNHDGHFTLATSGPVPWGTEVPGLIRWFNSRGREVMRRTFESGGSYTSSVREGSFGITGDRVIRLGTNMYREASLRDACTSGIPSDSTVCFGQRSTDPNPLAKEELNLLARLVQGSEGRSWAEASPAVRVSLFPSDPEEEEEEGGISTLEDEPSFGTINIQATKANDELSRIAAEFTEPREPSDSPDKGGDLLAMMDDL